jgi:hypothetical protein
MMHAGVVGKCMGKLLSRLEPGLLVPSGPWSPELQRDIESLNPGSDPAARALKSGLLLWNDDLGGCHTIAQELSDDFGSYLHGVMHRREPDYGNSKYWFRRVGEHPLFPELRAASLELLGDTPTLEAYRNALTSSKKWDPFRMIDWCESATEEREVSFLRAMQAIEIQGLTKYWLDRARLPHS